jgi:hypothetical protein
MHLDTVIPQYCTPGTAEMPLKIRKTLEWEEKSWDGKSLKKK